MKGVNDVKVGFDGEAYFFVSGTLYRTVTTGKSVTLVALNTPVNEKRETSAYPCDRISADEMVFAIKAWDPLGTPGVIWFTNGASHQVYKFDIARKEVTAMLPSSGSDKEGSISSIQSIVAVDDMVYVSAKEGLFKLDTTLRFFDKKTEESPSGLFHPALIFPSTPTARECAPNDSKTASSSSSATLPLIQAQSPTHFYSIEGLEKDRVFAWGSERGATSLYDLNTGRNIRICRTMELSPLVTVSPFVTIALARPLYYYSPGYAVRAKGRLSIVRVEWGPISYKKSHFKIDSIPESGITELFTLPEGITKASYSKTFNRLYVTDEEQLWYYSNFPTNLPSSFSSNSDIRMHQVSEESNKKKIEKREDISSLLIVPEKDYLSLDTQIIHKASNSTWLVHSDVLKLHSGLETRNRIENTFFEAIRDSECPSSSIDALIRYLYLTPIDRTNDYTQSEEYWDHAFSETNDMITIAEKVGMDTKPLLFSLKSRIIVNMSGKSILYHLLKIIVDVDLGKDGKRPYRYPSSLQYRYPDTCMVPFVGIALAERARALRLHPSEMDRVKESFEEFPPTSDPKRLMRVATLLTILVDPKSKVKLQPIPTRRRTIEFENPKWHKY